ncbi:MAG TPA: hypothetical protein VFV67_34410 [Actinophytocola sp.]|uniref:hypothetical protein n=1 Tax=Actinophytocola sp. TaxID=1872138 RepID=UPI002DB8047D|nr:hypothetical protein [Actinophytocola sp.]HEU5475760.1 hypothetical protein [Actinophytocola sp.]
MIDTESLRDAFGELERHAPDEAAVLTGFRAGVVRRRRRRQLATVTGVAGTVAAVALGVVLAVPGAPGGGTGPATSSAAPAAPDPSVRLELPFTVGVPPAGYRPVEWRIGRDLSDVQYHGSHDGETVVVELSTGPRPPTELLSEEPETIAGRPGKLVRLLPDGAQLELSWQLDDGRWFTVRGPAELLSGLRATAQSLSVRPTPLDPTAGPDFSALPQGYAVAGWLGEGDTLTLATVCPVAKRLFVDCVRVSLRPGTAPGTTQVKSGGDVLDVPVDRTRVVNGVPTWATADGLVVHAQVDPGHWVRVGPAEPVDAADVDLMRAVAAATVSR